MIKGKAITDPDVFARINEVRQGVKNKYMRKAFSSVARQMMPAVRQMVPRLFGLLKMAMGNKSFTKGDHQKLAVGAKTDIWASVKHGKKYIKAQPWKYIHLVDQGTKYTRKHDFLQVQHNRDEYWWQIIVASLRNSLDKVMK